jgi:hypothetical protein
MPSQNPSSNQLVQVQTYQRSGLGALYNQNPWINTANMKFKNFDDLTRFYNLGDTVNFDLPPRFVGVNTLVANFEAAQQRLQPLTIDQQYSVSYSFSAQQMLFNVEDYMDQFGLGAVVQIGNKVGANVAQNARTIPFRCFGDGRSQITSFQQYAQALANFRNFGDPGYPTCVYVDDVTIPAVIASGLQQFVMNRNEEIGNSWELGTFSRAEFYSTNLLPVHIAGAYGQGAGLTLTITSISPDGTTISFSSSGGAEASALNKYDILTLDPSGVAGLFFLQFTGYEQSAQKVQVRVTANASSDSGGNVTATVYPPLVSKVDQPLNNSQNINLSLASLVGVQATIAGNRRCGLITGANPLYVGMPRLPEMIPFPTGNETDIKTGVAMRQYYGSVFGQNIQAMVHDIIWGSTAVPEYTMQIAYPL